MPATIGDPKGRDQDGHLAPLDIHNATEAELRKHIASFHDCEALYEKTNAYGQLNYAACGFHAAREIVLALEWVLDQYGYPPRPREEE